MTPLRRFASLSLFVLAALLPATSLRTQSEAGSNAADAQAGAPRGDRVLVHAGARPAGARYVVVVPPSVPSPERAYDGVQQYRDWRWYGTYGPAISRLRYDAWTSRFSPVPRYAYGWGYGAAGYRGYPHTVVWRR